jgi:hypothetical protein
MRKARLQRQTNLQTNLDEAVRKDASSPCAMSESDPLYFGYWSREEVLKFLKDLLETEHVGLTAFAAVGRLADLRVADLVFGSELAQGAICLLLRKEIAKRGGARAARLKTAACAPSQKRDFQDTVAFARDNQISLADMVEGAALNIFDSKLNAKLRYLQLLHRKQAELLEALGPNVPAAS